MCKKQNDIPLMKLKDVRLTRGLTVLSAAEKVGINETDLLYYEDHPSEVPLSVAIRILNVYKVPSTDFINFR